MDWAIVIEANRQALQRVLAELVVMAGPEVAAGAGFSPETRGAPDADGAPPADRTPAPDCAAAADGDHADRPPANRAPADRPADAGRPVDPGRGVDPGRPSPGAGARPTLPRHLHRAVLRLLRPAEAAVRRLIVAAARGLVAVLPPARHPAPARPATARGAPGPARPGAAWAGATKIPSLPLFDRLPRWPVPPRRRASGVPRISVPGFGVPFALPRPPQPGDRIDAARLAARLAALGRALDDLPGQAARFARWRARRLSAAGRARAEAASAAPRGSLRFCRLSPLRPGRPPGWRRVSVHPVDELLKDTQFFALEALDAPDTS